MSSQDLQKLNKQLEETKQKLLRAKADLARVLRDISIHKDNMDKEREILTKRILAQDKREYDFALKKKQHAVEEDALNRTGGLLEL